jgi:hypothetical protein
MFLLSIRPALVVLFIRAAAVPESLAFKASQAREKPHQDDPNAELGNFRMSEIRPLRLLN